MAKVLETSLENKLYEPQNMNKKTLLAIYQDAYFDASFDLEDDIGINVDGTLIYARVHKNRGVLELFAFWSLNPHVARTDFLDFVNNLNRSMPFARASIPPYNESAEVTSQTSASDLPLLWINTFLPFDAGITSYEIINTTRRFVSCANDAIRLRGNKSFFESQVGQA